MSETGKIPHWQSKELPRKIKNHYHLEWTTTTKKKNQTYFIGGSFILVDFQIWCHGFKDFFLWIELRIWFSFEAFHKYGISNVGT